MVGYLEVTIKQKKCAIVQGKNESGQVMQAFMMQNFFLLIFIMCNKWVTNKQSHPRFIIDKFIVSRY